MKTHFFVYVLAPLLGVALLLIMNQPTQALPPGTVANAATAAAKSKKGTKRKAKRTAPSRQDAQAKRLKLEKLPEALRRVTHRVIGLEQEARAFKTLLDAETRRMDEIENILDHLKAQLAPGQLEELRHLEGALASLDAYQNHSLDVMKEALKSVKQRRKIPKVTRGMNKEVKRGVAQIKRLQKQVIELNQKIFEEVSKGHQQIAELHAQFKQAFETRRTGKEPSLATIKLKEAELQETRKVLAKKQQEYNAFLMGAQQEAVLWQMLKQLSDNPIEAPASSPVASSSSSVVSVAPASRASSVSPVSSSSSSSSSAPGVSLQDAQQKLLEQDWQKLFGMSLDEWRNRQLQLRITMADSFLN